MKSNGIKKLPPMSAVEYAIENTFRNFFFGLRLALGWLIVIAPLLAIAIYWLPREGLPDPRTLPPSTMAVLISIAILIFLATLSIAVNWHCRILLNQTPRRLGWIRLDGVVWRYLGAFVLIALVLALVGAGVFAVLKLLVPALEPKIGSASAPIGYGVAAVLGLFGLFSWYRLSTWLPAIAISCLDYGMSHAWRSTRSNRIRFLGFTFWLLFGLATAAALGAGAFMAQKTLANPWATGAAFGFIGILVWLALFLITTIATSHYYYFGDRGEFPE